MKKQLIVYSMLFFGCAALFGQSIEAGIGWTNIIGTTAKELSSKNSIVVNKVEESATSNFLINARLFMSNLGSAKVGLGGSISIGSPYSYKFPLPRPLAVQEEVSHIKYSSKDGTILDIGGILGVSYKQNLIGPLISFTMDAGLSFHVKTIDIQVPPEPAYADYGMFIYNLSDSTIGLGANAGIQANILNFFYAEAGLSLSFDLWRTVVYQGYYDKTEKDLDSSQYTIPPIRDSAFTNKVYIGAPYLLFGIRL
ncbi:MAG: hypothetical protein LBQ77_07050 [Treponema sp.]|jgi:hypothetical protein|nr:hypothetical protein [Treponema sp.]